MRDGKRWDFWHGRHAAAKKGQRCCRHAARGSILLAGPESAGSPENEPHVDDEGNELKNVNMETLGVQWGVEFVVVECFHRPADGGRTEFIVGGGPHELKSGAPSAQAFVGGILDGFAVGGPVDNEACVAAPVTIFPWK